MTIQEIEDLERAIELMRAAGHTKLPISLDVIEQWIARERKRLETVALGRGIELEAASTRDEMREWKQLVDEIATELLPLAEEQASQTEAAWHNGQSDIQTVLRAREQRLKLAAAKLDALKNFHLARVRHQAAVGNF